MNEREQNKHTYCQECGLCIESGKSSDSDFSSISDEELSKLMVLITKTVLEVLTHEGRLR